MIDRRAFMAASAAPLAGCATGAVKENSGSLLIDLDRAPDLEIDLWPKGAPGGENVTLTEHYVERENPFNLPDRAAYDVTRPTLSLFRSANPDGSAILLSPGGGYNYVVVEKEGFESARYFSRLGATVYVLKYRLPQQGWAAGPDTPLQDAQRAMRVIRGRAAEDGIDPARVVVMGFSAGGHVAGSLATRFDASVYDAIDGADSLSARPDGAALVYPVATMNAAYAHKGSRMNLIGENPGAALIDKYSLEASPPEDTPPTWLLHAGDDVGVPAENSLFFYRALRARKIPAEMHLFEKGGHGFGVRGIDDAPVGAWPKLFWNWASAHAL